MATLVRGSWYGKHSPSLPLVVHMIPEAPDVEVVELPLVAQRGNERCPELNLFHIHGQCPIFSIYWTEFVHPIVPHTTDS